MRLTTKTIEAMKPTAQRREIKDDGGRGLYLLIQPSGSKGWACRYYLDCKVRKATLGTWPQLGLAEARLAASKLFEQLERDVDPRQAEREAAALAKAERARTFGTIARRFLADCQHLRSVRDIRSKLAPVILAWEDRPLATIRRRDIIEIIDGIKAARGPYAAVNTQAWIKRCLSWCVEKAELEVSPAAGLRRPAPARVRERALTDDELRRLWPACAEAGFPFGPFTQLLLLTACRRGELASLRWSDVDMSDGTICIPGARYKNGKPHLIPLSRQARALLGALPRYAGTYVFSTPGSEKALGGFHWRQGKLDALLDPPLDAWSLHAHGPDRHEQTAHRPAHRRAVLGPCAARHRAALRPTPIRG